MTEAEESVVIAERIVARVQRGVPMGREMSAAEVRPLIAAYVTMRDAATAANAALQDAKARALD